MKMVIAVTHGGRASITEFLCMWEGTSGCRHTFHHKRLVILHSTCSTGSNKLNSRKKSAVDTEFKKREFQMRVYGTEKEF